METLGNFMISWIFFGFLPTSYIPNMCLFVRDEYRWMSMIRDFATVDLLLYLP